MVVAHNRPCSWTTGKGVQGPWESGRSGETVSTTWVTQVRGHHPDPPSTHTGHAHPPPVSTLITSTHTHTSSLSCGLQPRPAPLPHCTVWITSSSRLCPCRQCASSVSTRGPPHSGLHTDIWRIAQKCHKDHVTPHRCSNCPGSSYTEVLLSAWEAGSPHIPHPSGPGCL